MFMVDTKSLSDTMKAWEESIGVVPARYKRGVESAQNVIQKSKDAEDVWVARVTEAAQRRARSKGLDSVSDSDWKKAASEKGASRIGQGMNAGKDKFNKGMGEVLSTLQGITLPPRSADVSANIERVRVVAMALHERFKK